MSVTNLSLESGSIRVFKWRRVTFRIQWAWTALFIAIAIALDTYRTTAISSDLLLESAVIFALLQVGILFLTYIVHGIAHLFMLRRYFKRLFSASSINVIRNDSLPLNVVSSRRNDSHRLSVVPKPPNGSFTGIYRQSLSHASTDVSSRAPYNPRAPYGRMSSNDVRAPLLSRGNERFKSSNSSMSYVGALPPILKSTMSDSNIRAPDGGRIGEGIRAQHDIRIPQDMKVPHDMSTAPGDMRAPLLSGERELSNSSDSSINNNSAPPPILSSSRSKGALHTDNDVRALEDGTVSANMTASKDVENRKLPILNTNRDTSVPSGVPSPPRISISTPTAGTKAAHDMRVLNDARAPHDARALNDMSASSPSSPRASSVSRSAAAAVTRVLTDPGAPSASNSATAALRRSASHAQLVPSVQDIPEDDVLSHDGGLSDSSSFDGVTTVSSSSSASPAPAGGAAAAPTRGRSRGRGRRVIRFATDSTSIPPVAFPREVDGDMVARSVRSDTWSHNELRSDDGRYRSPPPEPSRQHRSVSDSSGSVNMGVEPTRNVRMDKTQRKTGIRFVDNLTHTHDVSDDFESVPHISDIDIHKDSLFIRRSLYKSSSLARDAARKNEFSRERISGQAIYDQPLEMLDFSDIDLYQDPVVTLWPLGAFIHQQYWATSQTLSTSLLSPALFLFFALTFSLASIFGFGEWRMLLRDDINDQFMLNSCVFATYSQLLLLVVHLLTPCYPLPGGVFFSRALRFCNIDVEPAASFFTGCQLTMVVAIVLINTFTYSIPHACTSIAGLWVITQLLVQWQYREKGLLVAFHPLFKLWPKHPMTLELLWRHALTDWDMCRPNIESVWAKFGIPPSVRPDVWPLLIGNSQKINPNVYSHLTRDLQQSNERWRRSIDENVTRMFSDIVVPPPTQARISNILQCYAAFADSEENAASTSGCQCYSSYQNDTDFGQPSVPGCCPLPLYHQGLDYLVLLLDHWGGLSPSQTFVALCNLLASHEITFEFDEALIAAKLDVFKSMLSVNLPELTVHLRQLGVAPEYCILQWFPTLFSTILPPPILCRVFDEFLREGEVALFKTAVVCFASLSESLMGCTTNPECMRLLDSMRLSLPADDDLEEDTDGVAKVPIYKDTASSDESVSQDTTNAAESVSKDTTNAAESVSQDTTKSVDSISHDTARLSESSSKDTAKSSSESNSRHTAKLVVSFSDVSASASYSASEEAEPLQKGTRADLSSHSMRKDEELFDFVMAFMEQLHQVRISHLAKKYLRKSSRTCCRR